MLEYDFMSDVFIYGREVRIFNIIDDYNCEDLIVNTRLTYPARVVIEIFEKFKKEIRG